MPALAIVEAQVVLGANASSMTRNAAAVITAGDAMYLDSNNNWALAQADGTAIEAAVAGIALNGAAIGQPVTACIGGQLTLGAGAAPVVGQIYVVGAVAGEIVPYADLLSTNRVSLIGWGIAANAINVAFQITGVAKA